MKKVICFIPELKSISDANDATDSGNCDYGCFNVSNIGWVKPYTSSSLPVYDTVMFWWGVPAADPDTTDEAELHTELDTTEGVWWTELVCAAGPTDEVFGSGLSIGDAF